MLFRNLAWNWSLQGDAISCKGGGRACGVLGHTGGEGTLLHGAAPGNGVTGEVGNLELGFVKTYEASQRQINSSKFDFIVQNLVLHLNSMFV